MTNTTASRMNIASELLAAAKAVRALPGRQASVVFKRAIDKHLTTPEARGLAFKAFNESTRGQMSAYSTPLAESLTRQADKLTGTSR